MAVRKGIATWPADRANRVAVKTVETLGADRTITVAEIERYQVFLFDPGGSARNVDLPAEEHCKGVVIFLSNRADGAEVITVRNDAAATITTPTQNEASVLFCDGVSWCGLTGAQS
jgi:hypothetical protein